jgi:hypothetical protein
LSRRNARVREGNVLRGENKEPFANSRDRGRGMEKREHECIGKTLVANT